MAFLQSLGNLLGKAGNNFVQRERNGLHVLLSSGPPRDNIAAPQSLAMNSLVNFHPGFQLGSPDFQIPTQPTSDNSNILKNIKFGNNSSYAPGIPPLQLRTPQWSQYGDSAGNRWLENTAPGGSATRIPIKRPQFSPPADTQLIPHTPFTQQMQLAPFLKDPGMQNNPGGFI